MAKHEDDKRAPFWKELIDRTTSFLNVSKSIYVLILAIVGLIVTNQTDAIRRVFAFYVVGRSWLEGALVLAVLVVIRILIKRIHGARNQGTPLAVASFWDWRVLLLCLISTILAVSLIPPLIYIALARYHFWTSDIQGIYVAQIENRTDALARDGKIDDALSLIGHSSVILDNTSRQDQLKARKERLSSLADRSRDLDDWSMDSWNFVTQRQKYFWLVDAVRLNPQNTNASQRLSAKLQTLENYLNQDAEAICALPKLPTTFSGKVVSLVEARAVWSEVRTSDKCGETVRAELFDGWGIDQTKCILKMNSLIQQGKQNISLDAEKCPLGIDFWSPLHPHEESSLEDTDAGSVDTSAKRPLYPTFRSVWRRYKAHFGSNSAEKAK